MYRAIKASGLDLKSAYNAFDSNGDNEVTKEEMAETLMQMNI